MGMKKTFARVVDERDQLLKKVARLENDLDGARRDLAEICDEAGIDLSMWRWKRNVHMRNALFSKLVSNPSSETQTFEYNSGEGDREED